VHKSSFNLKSIFSTSSFQLLIFISGLVINKCIAIYSGPAGIALFGVIKNFHVFFGSILKLGSDNVIINRASKASKSNAQKKELISSILKLCIFQIMFVFFTFIIMDGLIYDLVFQSIMPSEEKWLVRLILILIFLTVFSEMIVSFFNGLLDLKKYSFQDSQDLF
jgi:O-antigen/teichoic acid export membrane protein